MSTTSAKEQARKAFSGRAVEWAGWYADTEPRTLTARNLLARQRLALEMIEAVAPPPARVLDLGCGTGDTSGALMRRGYDVRGVDIAAPMIQSAGERWGRDRFQVGDTEHIPFDDRTFDAVVCLGVIEYQDDDARTLGEIMRVLKPGGVAIISTPSSVSPLYLIDVLVRLVESVVRPIYHYAKYTLRGRDIPGNDPGTHVTIRQYRRSAWLRRIRAAGFQPEEWICHGWGWYRSRFGIVAEWLAHASTAMRRTLEAWVGRTSVAHACGRFVRIPAVSWLAAEQIVRIRATHGNHPSQQLSPAAHEPGSCPASS